MKDGTHWRTSAHANTALIHSNKLSTAGRMFTTEIQGDDGQCLTPTAKGRDDTGQNEHVLTSWHGRAQSQSNVQILQESMAVIQHKDWIQQFFVAQYLLQRISTSSHYFKLKLIRHLLGCRNWRILCTASDSKIRKESTPGPVLKQEKPKAGEATKMKLPPWSHTEGKTQTSKVRSRGMEIITVHMESLSSECDPVDSQSIPLSWNQQLMRHLRTLQSRPKLPPQRWQQSQQLLRVWSPCQWSERQQPCQHSHWCTVAIGSRNNKEPKQNKLHCWVQVECLQLGTWN